MADAIAMTDGILECISAYVGPGKAILVFVMVVAFAITGEVATLDVCMQMIFSYIKTRAFK